MLNIYKQANNADIVEVRRYLLTVFLGIKKIVSQGNNHICLSLLPCLILGLVVVKDIYKMENVYY